MARILQLEIFGTQAQLEDFIAELEADGYVKVGPEGPKELVLDLVLRELEEEEDTGGLTYSIHEENQ